MNIERINDYIDAYSRAINITPEVTSILKELIPNLVKKYSATITSIPVEQDGYDKYVIKPVDGKYSMEDFFLNRLFRNVWEVYSKTNSVEKGGFEPNYMEIGFNMPLIEKQLVGSINTECEDFKELDAIARKKVIMHEFEHALQTQYSGKALFDIRYKRIFEEIRKAKDGKYKDETNEYSESVFRNDYGTQETYTHSGLHYSGKNKDVQTYREVSGFDNLNEIFNETEALDMAGARPQVVGRYKNNTYYRIRNVESSNSSITNYGVLLKALLGPKETFIGMYLDPNKMFTEFNKEYNTIFQEAFGNDKSAWENVINQIESIKASDSLEGHLKLDTVLAKCLKLKVESTIQKGNTSPKTLSKMNEIINSFYNNTISSQDESIRKSMEHIQILDSIQERVNQLKQEVTLPKQKEEPVIDPQTKQPENSLRSNGSENKMKFVHGFIQAYNNTETEPQYEYRQKFEASNIQRVQEIIRTNGLNVMLTANLDGNLVETTGGEFRRQYSEKQVSAMAQLLKAAQLLTSNKNLNPTGRNYLEEFSSVPSIESKLKQMKEDFNDKDSYMSKLRKESMLNRAKNTLPKFPKTQGEIDAASSTVRDSDGPVLKQEMGITDEQVEKMKHEKEHARYQADDKKRKASEEEKAENNEKFTQQKKLEFSFLRRELSNSDVTTSEVVQTQKEIAERKQMQVLSIKSRAEHLSTEEQQIFDMLRAKYERTQQEQSNDRKKSKGIER